MGGVIIWWYIATSAVKKTRINMEDLELQLLTSERASSERSHSSQQVETHGYFQYVLAHIHCSAANKRSSGMEASCVTGSA